jgi:hypothetical protein
MFPPPRTLNQQQWVVTKRDGRNKDFLLGHYIQTYFFFFIPYTQNTRVNPIINPFYYDPINPIA